MNFTQAVTAGYQGFVKFNGRSSRSEFWYWTLFQVIVSVVISFIFGGGHMTTGEGGVSMNYEGGLVANLWALANLLPGIAVSIRRLHDINRSGWWLFIALIPLVGWIILIVWDCQEGTAGDNQYGPPPATSMA